MTETDPLRCGHCPETFGDERKRAQHWYWEHFPQDLDGEEFRAAHNERVRRDKAHTFAPVIEVEIPRSTWEHILDGRERTGKSTDVRPADVEGRVFDYMESDYRWTIVDGGGEG